MPGIEKMLPNLIPFIMIRDGLRKLGYGVGAVSKTIHQLL